jgi:tRNA threonylcarbamoyladenosine biosynthesis protein TsaB
LPVVPVSTLAALAQGCAEAGVAERVLVAVDARMDEVYWGAFVRGPEGLVEPAGGECVIAPESVPLPEGGDWFGAGSGWQRYAEALTARIGGRLAGADGDALPDARWVAKLAAAAYARGEAVSAEQAQPIYLRDQVASLPKSPGS